MRRRTAAVLMIALAAVSLAAADPLAMLEALTARRTHEHKVDPRPAVSLAGVPDGRLSGVACEEGFAGPFPCAGVDLLSFVPLTEFRGDDATLAPLGIGLSDIWGWTDPATGDEYVIFGKTNGTAFFRVTDPLNPTYLGEIVNASAQLVWHDIKVFRNHAFIVSESNPHGMKVFDLTRLRDVTQAQDWLPDTVYPGSAWHNIAINEDTGFAYLVGGNAGLVAPDPCLSGLHIVDINNPQVPTFAGCYLVDGGPGTAASLVGSPAGVAYVHDTQCVIYEGPDAEHRGQEICFNSSETHLAIADVTDKLNPVTISVLPYDNVSYAHQGWLTEDQGYFFLGDEGDETAHDITTRTVVFDVTDLDAPAVHFEHDHGTASIDHNMYVDGALMYQSNYTSGVRVLDVGGVADGALDTVAWFDVFPAHDDAVFSGTWSNYPYFASGTIAATGIDEGLFLLRLDPDVAEEYGALPAAG